MGTKLGQTKFKKLGINEEKGNKPLSLLREPWWRSYWIAATLTKRS